MVVPRKPFSFFPVWVIVVCVITWLAALHLKLNSGELKDALRDARQYLSRFFPPAYEAAQPYSKLLWESVAMAVWGTAIAFVLAILSTLTAARNFSPHPLAYSVTRAILSVARVLPDYIMAIIFVSAFGPGPLAGVITVTVGCLGQLGKLCNDALERVDSGVLEGIEASGGYGFQRLRFGGWPSVTREFWGFSLLAFDRALRESAVIGVVGAGGIGMELSLNLRLFDYQRAAIIIIMIIAIILVNETISTAIRKRLA